MRLYIKEMKNKRKIVAALSIAIGLAIAAVGQTTLGQYLGEQNTETKEELPEETIEGLTLTDDRYVDLSQVEDFESLVDLTAQNVEQDQLLSDQVKMAIRELRQKKKVTEKALESDPESEVLSGNSARLTAYVKKLKPILAAAKDLEHAGCVDEAKEGEYETLRSRYLKILNKARMLEDEADVFYGYVDVSMIRKQIVETALLMKGEITYVWGGKAQNPGWNDSWNTGGGLDCSGFVQWVFWTGANMTQADPDMQSTKVMASNLLEIDHDSLLPGDIGLWTGKGSYFKTSDGASFDDEASARAHVEEAELTDTSVKKVCDHAGIYVGQDQYGNDLWVHCVGSTGDGTVVVDHFGFTKYYRHYTTEE